MDMYALFQVMQLLIRLLIYTFIGQGLLTLLAGARYRENPVWRFFNAITRPIWRLVRTVTPRFVGDGAIGFVAVVLMIALNIGLYMVFHNQGWITPPRTTVPA